MPTVWEKFPVQSIDWEKGFGTWLADVILFFPFFPPFFWGGGAGAEPVCCHCCCCFGGKGVLCICQYECMHVYEWVCVLWGGGGGGGGGGDGVHAYVCVCARTSTCMEPCECVHVCEWVNECVRLNINPNLHTYSEYVCVHADDSVSAWMLVFHSLSVYVSVPICSAWPTMWCIIMLVVLGYCILHAFL